MGRRFSERRLPSGIRVLGILVILRGRSSRRRSERTVGGVRSLIIQGRVEIRVQQWELILFRRPQPAHLVFRRLSHVEVFVELRVSGSNRRRSRRGPPIRKEVHGRDGLIVPVVFSTVSLVQGRVVFEIVLIDGGDLDTLDDLSLHFLTAVLSQPRLVALDFSAVHLG